MGLQADLHLKNRVYLICCGQILCGSKWGHRSKWDHIKIQEDPLIGARNAITKFCSDPFCVISGA
jgi:hypothetical protein